MRVGSPARSILALVIGAACALLTPASARAQWTRVTALPSAFVYSLHVQGDTIVAGMDSVAWVSTNGGGTWRRSATVGVAPAYLDAVWFRDGRLWAGTGGQGVFTSDDFGTTWQPRSDGLTGGLFNSHNFLHDFVARGDDLYGATGGAGVFVRPLRTAGPWQPTGGELVANQAGQIEQLAVHGSRLIAAGGANGLAFRNDGGAPWVAMPLDNTGPLAGLAVMAVEWTGSAWLVGTDHGFYRSPDGANPWTFIGLNLSGTMDSKVASGGGRTFVCLNRTSGGRYLWTRDDGATWFELETLPSHATELAVIGDRLWAARGDGLWTRDVGTLEVPPLPVPRALAMTLRGAHPVVGALARIAVRLERESRARLEVFDVSGRRVHVRVHELPPGEHELALDVGALESGMYLARIQAGDRSAAVRFVRLKA